MRTQSQVRRNQAIHSRRLLLKPVVFRQLKHFGEVLKFQVLSQQLRHLRLRLLEHLILHLSFQQMLIKYLLIKVQHLQIREMVYLKVNLDSLENQQQNHQVQQHLKLLVKFLVEERQRQQVDMIFTKILKRVVLREIIGLQSHRTFFKLEVLLLMLVERFSLLY